jgi:hypothetical protein
MFGWTDDSLSQLIYRIKNPVRVADKPAAARSLSRGLLFVGIVHCSGGIRDALVSQEFIS